MLFSLALFSSLTLIAFQSLSRQIPNNPKKMAITSGHLSLKSKFTLFKAFKVYFCCKIKCTAINSFYDYILHFFSRIFSYCALQFIFLYFQHLSLWPGKSDLFRELNPLRFVFTVLAPIVKQTQPRTNWALVYYLCLFHIFLTYSCLWQHTTKYVVLSNRWRISTFGWE